MPSSSSNLPPSLRVATLADLPQLHRSMGEFYTHESLVLDDGVLGALHALIENPNYGQAFIIRSPDRPPQIAPDNSAPQSAELKAENPTNPANPAHAAKSATIGYCILTFGYSVELHGRTALIDELYLPPADRGRGLGTQVLEALIQLCREQGIRMLELEVRRDNPKARGLYERLGFQQHSRDILRFYPQ
ncbi:MAG: GNAT family N-acetyltransferase [Prochlorothrix sp.]